MQEFKGRLFAIYSLEEVEEFFRNNPDTFDTKRGWELIVGCVLARCRKQIANETMDISYMVKGLYPADAKEYRPELGELFEKDIIEDQDVDLFLRHPGIMSKVQITRLEDHGAGKDPNLSLINLIRKKCLIQPDPVLQLIVLIDHKFDMKIKWLGETLQTMDIPYGRIYLVGQEGLNPVAGEFRCTEIYPEDYYSDVILDIY